MFRQFPATGPDGENYVIIEFRDGDKAQPSHEAPRYELADGRHLVREGQRYTTRDGGLTLQAG